MLIGNSYRRVWRILGGVDRVNQVAIRKTLGRTFISLDQLQTVVIEIESMLNDRPLTYVNSDLQDPQPLIPSHLLHGRRIQQIPHPLNDSEELADPIVVYGIDLRNRMDKLNGKLLIVMEESILDFFERILQDIKVK